ncbi:MAG: NINE protein [Clostridia bacterium]|nr:NINE protein [Clostridia bacterium]
MICPKCGMNIALETDTCPNCGMTLERQTPPEPQSQTPVTDNMQAHVHTNTGGFCPNCGAPHAPDAIQCLNCGIPLGSGYVPVNPNQVPQPPRQRSRLIAAFLALFFGAFGLENFYLGDSTLGVLQILVTLVTCGFGGTIWGFVDAIKLLTYKKNADAYGIPLKDFDF